MESIYLPGTKHKPNWCSKKVTIKDYFSKYSTHVVNNIYPSSRLSIRDITRVILPEEDIPIEKLHNLKKYMMKGKSIQPLFSDETKPLKSYLLSSEEDEPGVKIIHNNSKSAEELSDTLSEDEDIFCLPNKTYRKRKKYVSMKRNKANLSDEQSGERVETVSHLKKSKEALEVVPNLLESMISNVFSQTNTITGENSSTVSDSNLKKQMSTRKNNEQSIDRTDSPIHHTHKPGKKRKSQVQEKDKLHLEDLSDPVEENQYFQGIIDDLKKRNLSYRKLNPSVRGLICVDTTMKSGKRDLKARENFVVSFRVHKHFKHSVGERGSRPGKCVQEIEILHYQTLADLRNKIFCESDFQDTAGDVSNCPDSKIKCLSKEKYRSGMFYIGNTFYVDTHEGTEDYSKEVRKWGEACGVELGGTVPMEDMKIEDLEVRYGYPYVYKHQGSCEHLIIINDARMLTEKDSLHSSDYPNMTKTARTLVKYCGTCGKKAARWVVVGTNHLPYDYNLMCNECFKSCLYINGKKVDDFKAYRWYQRPLLFH